MSRKIQYVLPVDWVRGSISERQHNIVYGGVQAYEVQGSDYTPADNYSPIIVARYLHARDIRCYQVRTKTAVHISAQSRMNMAVLGGAGAIFAALLNRGEHMTRAVTFPRLMSMLRLHASSTQSEGLTIDNPWVVSNPNVTIQQEILTKFNILS